MKQRALIVALAGLTMTASTAAMADVVVKLGFAGPLTGPVSHLGKDEQYGAQLALDDANAKGVVLGGQKVRFELMPEDDQADPRTATTVAQRLVDAGVKGVVGHVTSGAAIPASRIYEQAGVPSITPSATSPKLTQQKFKTTYRVIANDMQQGAAMARFATEALKAKRIAVIDDRTAYGQGLADALVDNLKRLGVTPVGREFTNDKATDFMAILTSLKGKQPEAIFYGGYAPQAAPMARQMKQLGISAKLLGGDTLCSPEVAKLAGDAVNDFVYCAYAGMLMDANDTTKAFQDKFKKRFGQNPDVYGPAYYDQVMFIGEAMQKSGSIDPAKVGDWMRKNPYKGVLGEYGYDDKGNRLKAPTVVNTFKNGKPMALSSQ